jgi:hypothetical protein
MRMRRVREEAINDQAVFTLDPEGATAEATHPCEQGFILGDRRLGISSVHRLPAPGQGITRRIHRGAQIWDGE